MKLNDGFALSASYIIDSAYGFKQVFHATSYLIDSAYGFEQAFFTLNFLIDLAYGFGDFPATLWI